MDLHADGTSTGPMAGNQLRLWFAIFACILVSWWRALALPGTRLSKTTAGRIRLHWMKVAVRVIVSARRIHVRLAGAPPMADVLAEAHRELRKLPDIESGVN